MYNVLVTGNGFDIEHKIPSSYKNFLDFTKKFVEFYRYKDDTSIYVIQCGNSFKNNIEKISPNYKDILSVIKEGDESEKACLDEFYNCIYNNSWIAYFQQCLEKREAYGKEYNWVDIEEEITNVVKEMTLARNEYGFVEIPRYAQELLDDKDNKHHFGLLINIMNSIRVHSLNKDMDKESYGKSDIELQKLDKNYKSWVLAKQNLLTNYQKMIRALEIYLDFIIDSSKIRDRDYFKTLRFDRVITFNYTDTYKKCYKDTVTYFIHGKASSSHSSIENNMVVGIDEFLPDEQKNRDIEFIDYRKYYQRIVKRCDFHYRQDFENEDNVITWFFGHSMSATDKDVLIHLLPADNNKILKSYICYHNDNSFRQQVTNLIQILGQDQLNELVCGVNPKVMFISQNNIVEEMEKSKLDKGP